MSNQINADVTSSSAVTLSDVTHHITKSLSQEVEKSATVHSTPNMTPNLTPTKDIQDTPPYPLEVETIDTSAINLIPTYSKIDLLGTTTSNEDHLSSNSALLAPLNNNHQGNYNKNFIKKNLSTSTFPKESPHNTNLESTDITLIYNNNSPLYIPSTSPLTQSRKHTTNNITIPISSIYIDITDSLENAKNSTILSKEKDYSEEITTLPKLQEHSSKLPNHELTNSYCNTSNFPHNTRGTNFLCNSSPTPKPYSTLMAGNELAGTSSVIQCSSRGEASISSSTKPDLSCPSSLGGNENCHGNIQQPLMVVNSSPTTTKLPIPPDPLLPSSIMGNAPVQPTKCDSDCGTPNLSTILLPTPDSRDTRITSESMELSGAAQAYHMGQDNARENSPQVVPDIGTSNPQVLPHHIIPPLSPLAATRGENVDVREVEEAISLMRETRTKIGVLKEIKIIIFKERFEKKHILICPPHLLKSSIDIRAPRNPGVGNFVVILNPYLATLNPLRMEREMTENGTNQTNRAINIIIWNCRGCNGDDFRRNFRSLIDWHKPPLVALVETKMQDHQPLLDNFPYTNMIQVPSIGSSGGLAILWDNTVFELEEISTSGQEIHAMVKRNKTGRPYVTLPVYSMLGSPIEKNRAGGPVETLDSYKNFRQRTKNITPLFCRQPGPDEQSRQRNLQNHQTCYGHLL
ncbi:hypothetical protein KY285_001368 [Solanum tuberosum]|nr:hypothetical protein KY285_001368 [Solanum tuberosum]